MLTLWPLLFYGRSIKLLVRSQKQVCGVIRLLGELELAIASASFCAGVPGWCTPQWADGKEPVRVEVPNYIIRC